MAIQTAIYAAAPRGLLLLLLLLLLLHLGFSRDSTKSFTSL
jgi:hypothetical protein